jgi:hypothetical protein
MDTVEKMMFGFFAIAIVAIIGMMVYTTYDCINNDNCPKNEPQSHHDPDGIGMGLSYRGKLGMEIAPGMVMDFEGNVGPGFGF